MKFTNLKEKCEYYRSLQDTRLIPGLWTLVMLDGRSFSKMIKNKYKLPFDSDFIDMMNKTAEKVCKEVQGSKFAYVQSDEISIVLSDFDTIDTESFFSYRIEKMLSIIPGIATGQFNKLATKRWIDSGNKIEDYEPIQFDGKVWQVPCYNDMMAWFLYRQLDCIKNSKNQVAQQYFSHKQAQGITADDLIQKLKDEGKVDWWHEFNDGEKFGRFIWKEMEKFHNDKLNIDYDRSIWKSHYAWELSDGEGREKFKNLGIWSENALID